ncbi:MAG: Dyp-type peroxidase, partial [Burkholderiales bacterium]
MERLELNDIQGMLRGGYRNLPETSYLLLRVEDPAGARAWLRSLLQQHWIDRAAETSASSRLHDDLGGGSICFTADGLKALGIGAETLRMFPSEFQEGMNAPHRARALGDVGASEPGRWSWGGSGEVHILLMLFASAGRILRCVETIRAIPGFPRLLQEVRAVLQPREPFGFADGIANPDVEGLTPRKGRPENTVKPGEFVLGYLDETGHRPASPTLALSADPQEILLRTDGGRADLGRNGSYFVLRQLSQNVEAYRAFVRDDPLRAARLVGRWESGAPLVRYDADPRPQRFNVEDDFAYHRNDRHGLRCPIGAHIRRANPRDSLAEQSGVTPEAAQKMANLHRLLRRGRVYETQDEIGLMFGCLNANIERQFEFVQQSWLMNPDFGELRGETDPLLGNCPAGKSRHLTLQKPILRERMEGLTQFVTVRGGAYFFLPGLRALDFL